MALNMENPLQPSFEGQLVKTLQDTQDCIAELRHEWEDMASPITDDSQMLQRFCAKLEYLLQAGMKSKSSLIGGKKDYWNYIAECLSGNKGLSDGIQFVKSQSELKTNLGRGRALLRFCLMHRRLADTIQQCVYKSKVTLDWYLPNAVWLQPNQVSALLNSLYDLNDLQFDLSPGGYDLDTSWPTFARKTFNAGNNWAPPSRTISVSSLASTSDVAQSCGSEAELEKYRSQLTDTESAKMQLQVRLESVEGGRADMEKKLAELEIQLSNSQRTCNQFELQCDKLETEIKLREETWLEKEAIWKSRGDEMEKTILDMTETIRKKEKSTDCAAGGTPNDGAISKFDLTELQCKLAAKEKSIAALKIELRSVEMELRMKEKLDAGKTKLIELLERKVMQLQGRYDKVFDKLEESTSRSMEDRESKMNVLLDQLKVSEKVNLDLIKTNGELRKMLHELEDKSCKIAAIAKEKVLKYVGQSKTLQGTVDELTSKLSLDEDHADGNSQEVLRLTEELREAQRKIEELEGGKQKVEEPSDAAASPIVAMKFGYERLQERLQNGDETDSTAKLKQDKSELESRLAGVEEVNKKLQAENAELNAVVARNNLELNGLPQDTAGTEAAHLSQEDSASEAQQVDIATD